MEGHKHPLGLISHFIHRQFIWLLVSAYAIAAVFPGCGLWIRDASVGQWASLPEGVKLTLPMIMLAFLLFNAGLGVETKQLGNLLRNPWILVAGLIANLAIPITVILAVDLILGSWHNPDEVQNILVGLAVIASMPIAGSSTAWAQNTNGDMGLSVGLVLLSTALSPLTTPVALHSAGFLAKDEYSRALHALAGYGTGAFLLLCVIVPSALGILLRWLDREGRIAAAKPYLRLANSVNLLVLIYANASVSLPQAVAKPDWDFLGMTLGIVVLLCVLAFASGWLIARLLHAGHAQETSLMFGLGMNNNGTGLVLASMSLSVFPRVLLPIIFYNLVQHLVAGSVDFALGRIDNGTPSRAASAR